MKRIFALLVCFILMASLFAIPSYASVNTDVAIELPDDDGTGYPVIAISGDGYKNDVYATKVVIPNNIISLGEGVFLGCSKLRQIKLHGNIQVIEKDAFADTAFYNNEDNWDDGVLYIGDALIKADYKQMKSSYSIKEGCRIIADEAFEGCNLEEITIPDSVEYVGKNAFLNTKVMSEANYENGLLAVDNILLDCSKNYEGKVIIPAGVRTIADAAFKNCIHISEIEIPDSVTYIGQGAFTGCARLQKITLGRTVKTIGRNPFDICISLEQIIVSEENDYFTVVDGVLYNKELSQLIRCPQQMKGTVNIPCSVYKINAQSFEYCENITNVVIPNSATFIGKKAFANCSKLVQITIPSSMEYIAGYAFSECINLKSATIPDNVYFLGDAVFQKCTALESVHIGNKVEALGADLFQGCEKLNDVKLGDAIEKISTTAFSETKFISKKGNYTDGMLICRKYLIKVNETVKDCIIPMDVTIIADGAFKNANSLESVHISKTLEKFNYKAFCDILETPIYYEGGDIWDFYERTNFDSKINLFTKDYYTCFWCVIAFIFGSLFLFIGLPLIFNLKYKKLYETEENYDDEE